MSAVAVRRVRARLVPYRWRWAEENREAIAARWRERKAATPGIFDGRVLMTCGVRFAGDDCEAELFETGYSGLIAWVDAGGPGDEAVANAFAMGALQAADGAWLLGRMGPHTANAGRLYFPCGTPDRDDVGPDGTVDLARSLVREIEEETGFAAAELAVGEEWLVVRDGPLLGFMRPVRVALDGEAARARILAHLAREAEPELADVKLVRGPDDLAGEPRVPGVVPIYLRHLMGRG